MPRTSSTGIWALLYALLCLLPLIVAAISRAELPGRSFAVEASAALALLAFPAILMQFSLVPRVTRNVVLPADALMLFHREMGIIALAFAIAHPFLLVANGMRAAAVIPFAGGWVTTSGALAFWILLFVVFGALARRRLPASYERWHTLHILGSWLIVAVTVLHALAVDRVDGSEALGYLLMAYAAAFLALAANYRLARPLQMRRRPWIIVSNRDLGGRTRLLRVCPDGHDGFAFQPGQFAWVMTGRSPFAIEQHPISIASSAEPSLDRGLEFAVKMLGDWSRDIVPGLGPGRQMWIDGPFGGLTADGEERGRLILIAGGIGIAPMRSIVLTMADHRESRPVHLFYAAADRARAVFADELEGIAGRMSLTVTYVFEHPADAWQGERGYVGAGILERHLAPLRPDDRYVVCGPGPMMDAVERALDMLGVPGSAIHTERFDMV